MTQSGFGSGSFGGMPFGTGLPLASVFQLAALDVWRENALRLTFTEPPRYTQLGSPNDAADPRRYTLSPVPGSTGRDGEPARPVSIARVDAVAGAEGRVLELWTDRPLSPYPAAYELAVSGLVSATTTVPLPAFAVGFPGLHKGIPPLVPEFVLDNRDIANPQTRQGIFDPLPVEEGQALDPLLGTFPVDSRGDLAFDEGLAGYKKRVMRRLTTRRGKFAHLPNYGVSILQSVKQLARAGVRETLASEAESQIRQEPETVDVSVSLIVDEQKPNLSRYRIRARTSFGELPNFDTPITFGA